MKLFNYKTIITILLILFISFYTVSKIFLTNRIHTLNEINKTEEPLINSEITSENIKYIKPDEAFENILDSGYLKQFTQKDMEVRKCDTYEKCKYMYKNNLIEFTPDNKDELERLIKLCNEKTKNFKGLYNITWKLCKTTTKLEEGMPHTHTDIIFLSDSFFRKNNDNSKIVTLIHEKIHLFQRIYKKRTQDLYEKFNFSKVPKKKINLRRTNPDLDSFDYNYNGVLIYSEYKDNAKTLSDVDTKFISVETKNNKDIREIEQIAKNGYQNEHPNEIFASIISDKIVNGELTDVITNYLN